MANSVSITDLLERVPVEDINETAKRITPGRTFSAIVGGLLFLIGWLVAVIVGGIWYCCKWVFAAALVGWKTARHEDLMQPDIAQVLRENAFLRAEVQRLGG